MVLLFVGDGVGVVVVVGGGGGGGVVVEVRAVLCYPIHVQGKVPRRLIL